MSDVHFGGQEVGARVKCEGGADSIAVGER